MSTDTYTFTVVNGGTVGTDNGIQLSYRNSSGTSTGTITLNGSDAGVFKNVAQGIQVQLGAGTLVAGQTFYLFTIENLKHFGALKAMGVTNKRLIGMILLQAWSVGFMGYGLGVGLTAAFFNCTGRVSYMAGLFMGWYSMGIVALAIASIVSAAAFISMRKVLFLEPAVVFRGA